MTLQTAPRLLMATAILALTTGTSAQTPQPQVQTMKPAEQPAAGQQPPKPVGQLNIKLDLTLTDQRGDAPATPRVVSLIVGDRETGRIRTSRGVAMLNIDARADIPREGRIRVVVTLEYRTSADGSEPIVVSETTTVILEDGKPLVVSQSAEPGSDRRLRLEMKASVLR